MRKISRVGRLVAVLAVVTLVAAACSNDDGGGGDGDSGTPTEGGSAVFGAEQWMVCLNPITSCAFSSWYAYSVQFNTMPRLLELDTSDVDRWIGRPLGGGELKDPIAPNDVRRWAQGMQNPNPLHFDEVYALASRHGRLVAPQSFAVCTDTSHGAGPAIQGVIPGQHMIFGGDEWWFFGPRIGPGDRLRQDRMLFDYKVAETKFAGPTMFSRGDTTYVNQQGVVVCKQRSTSVRYRASDARERGLFLSDREPVWSDEQLAGLLQLARYAEEKLRQSGYCSVCSRSDSIHCRRGR